MIACDQVVRYIFDQLITKKARIHKKKRVYQMKHYFLDNVSVLIQEKH